MNDSQAPDQSPGTQPVYCRFGKRNLDGMSWLAPLVNNRIGDRLNLELRHEQLFFIQGDKILDDIGYSEKGIRFSEADMGKPIRSLADLTRNGYWLVGRSYDPEIMREALATQEDGLYYSVLANQCQDWTDRLRRSAERIEKQRGLRNHGSAKPETNTCHYSKPVSATEPGSVALGLVALGLGAAAVCGPLVAGHLFTIFIALMFLLSGGAQVAYALHAQDWRNMLPILLTASGCLLTGLFIALNRELALMATGSLVAGMVGIQGLATLSLGAGTRPLKRGLGHLLGGATMMLCATFILLRWPPGTANTLGIWVGLALLAGGGSTIWLSWCTRHDDPSPPK